MSIDLSDYSLEQRISTLETSGAAGITSAASVVLTVGGSGSISAHFNAAAYLVLAGEVPYVEYDGKVYAYTGPKGSPAVSAGDAEFFLVSDPSAAGAGPLNDLTDVDTAGVIDGDALVYDNASSTWKPSAVAGGAAPVTSVLGRAGVVVAVVGDYSDSQVTATPAVALDWDAVHTDVGAATDELAARLRLEEDELDLPVPVLLDAAKVVTVNVTGDDYELVAPASAVETVADLAARTALEATLAAADEGKLIFQSDTDKLYIWDGATSDGVGTIFDSDLAMTEDRTHDGAGFALRLEDLSRFRVTSVDGAGHFSLIDDTVTAVGASTTHQAQSPGAGDGLRAAFTQQATTDTTAFVRTRVTDPTGNIGITVSSTAAARTILVETPSLATASDGQVLTLVDAATGEVEFADSGLGVWEIGKIYAAGAQVIVPGGFLASSNSARTSGPSFDMLESAEWTFIDQIGGADPWVASTFYQTGSLVTANGMVLRRLFGFDSGLTFNSGEMVSWEIVSQDFVPEWAAATAYMARQKVFFDGVLYQKSAVASDSSAQFDTSEQTNWQRLSPDQIFQVQGPVDFTLAEPVNLPGQRYLNTVTGNTSTSLQPVQENSILLANGATWSEFSPYIGMAIVSQGVFKYWDGSEWAQPAPKSYEQSFAITDWVGPAAGVYTLQIAALTHDLALTVTDIRVFEDDGTSWIPTRIDSSINKLTGDITLSINEIPDARFDGRVIIS